MIDQLDLIPAQPYVAKARQAFETWATIAPSQIPADPLDAMQVKLMRWQRENFSKVTTVEKHDLQMTLGLIEEFGEMSEAMTLRGKHGKLDALGDIEVYAGQLCISYRLALRPLLSFADLLFDQWMTAMEMNPSGKHPIPLESSIVGKLSHITLKRDQKIRGFDSDDKFLPAFVLYASTIIALAKVDMWSLSDHPDYKSEAEPSQEPIDWYEVITDTYLTVGETVLSRNWNKDKLAGQTG